MSQIPRLLIAGTQAGIGKTTLTLGLCHALRARGLRVAVFKCGPDYLDVDLHARASQRHCHNLDGWMMGRDAVLATFERGSAGADVALIEGNMGLFDGASSTADEGSTAEIAKWLSAPVLLAVDACGMLHSIAALAKGFAEFDPDVNLSGLLCNRLASLGQLDMLGRASQAVPVLGGLPNDKTYKLPERLQGQHTNPGGTDALIACLGEDFAAFSAVERLIDLARKAAPKTNLQTAAPRASTHAPTKVRPCRIGIAKDAAFYFYYDDNLRQLEACGATLVPFSPMHDVALPRVDGLYFGGGLLDGHAEPLAANVQMRDAVAAFARAQGPVYAECGGLMYLTDSITTLEGSVHPMVGALPCRTLMRPKIRAFGHVEVETQSASIVGPAGLSFRGHQVRYAEFEGHETLTCAYSLRKRRGGDTFHEGYVHAQVLASHVHAHWASNPVLPEKLAAACHAFAQKQQAVDAVS